MKIFVFAEKYDALTELCNVARQFGDRVEAIIIGRQDINDTDKSWSIPAQDGAMLEDYTDTIASLIDKEKPDLILIQSTKRCKLIAGRLAAIIGASVITDVIELTKEGEFKRLVYGGTAIRREKNTTPTAIAMVGSGVVGIGSEKTSGKGELETLEFIEPGFRMNIVSREQKPKINVNLPLAKKVIGVGRGLAKEDDLAMIHKLAQIIGGEVGCTKSIAEEEKWLPKETCIGLSGLKLAPEVYLAIGISGQIQHMIGINRAKVVIAINKDKHAPIFTQADYGIVGDIYTIVPYMINQLNKH